MRLVYNDFLALTILAYDLLKYADFMVIHDLLGVKGFTMVVVF
jgi:hypothetical protein